MFARCLSFSANVGAVLLRGDRLSAWRQGTGLPDATALKNRIQAIDQFAWPGLDTVLTDPFSPLTRWFRQQWYPPQRVLAAGATGLEQAWQATPAASAYAAPRRLGACPRALGATDTGLGGVPSRLTYLQAEVTRAQTLLALVEEQHHTVQCNTVRPRYRRLHPSRNLETLKGVGQEGAAVYVSFIGDPHRFSDHRHFCGWTGMIPDSRQSGTRGAKGLHISF